jgi:site-specific recombinase XerD
MLAAIHREHVESFIESLSARFKPATAANRYAGLRASFAWAVDEGTITVMGKGRRERKSYVGTKAILAMVRYLRKRREHPHAAKAAWWVGQHGR